MKKQLDLFGDTGETARPIPQSGGYAAPPGSGPPGRICGGCEHYCRVHSAASVYRKCGLCEKNWTHGKGSDIKRSSPACAMYSDQAEIDRAKLDPYLGARALSIRAPWPAWIFGTGPDRKCWENRVWHPDTRPRYRGPILIHLSNWWDGEIIEDQREDAFSAIRNIERRLPDIGTPETLAYMSQVFALRGHLLGWVDLVEIADGKDHWNNPWVSCGEDSPPNHCVLRLENPRLLETPVPCRGHLGLFHVRHEATPARVRT